MYRLSNTIVLCNIIEKFWVHITPSFVNLIFQLNKVRTSSVMTARSWITVWQIFQSIIMHCEYVPKFSKNIRFHPFFKKWVLHFLYKKRSAYFLDERCSRISLEPFPAQHLCWDLYAPRQLLLYIPVPLSDTYFIASHFNATMFEKSEFIWIHAYLNKRSGQFL